ncbi:CHASE domain-containing protein [Pseudoduganella sp. UC29_106]|uniref:CHASE domain-containing protein n=1 Tax=Pseudoduganella sp. UC29_106 TaxID=3374553 RepID=UPI003757336C
MAHRRRRTSVYGAAALTFGAGLAVTAVLFVAVSALEYGKQELGFQQRANARVAAIRRGLDDAVEVLSVTNQLFRTVAPVSREQFYTFSKPLLERYPFIQAFNFHRLLPHADRAAYEASMRVEHPGFTITELTDTSLVAAPQHPFYNVVDYIEPLAGNEAALGLNVAPNLAVQDAIERILQTGLPSATSLLRLAQTPSGQRGFILIMPVYRPGAPTDTYAERHAAWLGDTAAVIRIHHLVYTILQNNGLLDDPQVMLRVYADDPAQPENLVYSHGVRTGDSGSSLLHDWLNFHYRDSELRSFDVLGRTWHVRVEALPRPFLDDHLGSLGTLLGGILFSILECGASAYAGAALAPRAAAGRCANRRPPAQQ